MDSAPDAPAPPTRSAIVTRDLSRVYRMGGQDIPALRGVNMTVPAGRYVSLKGRSGSGKTTLLNCVGGLDRPTSGTVSIFGEEVGRWSERKLTQWRRNNVGFVFQSFGLMPTLSAYENVELMLRMSGASGARRREHTVHCLEQVGLTKWMHHRPFELSGGQQQRVAIARSLANSPSLILADEPTGELDSQTAREILGLFKTIVEEQRVTILMVTHDSLSDEYVDTTLYLRDGAIMSATDMEAAALEEQRALAQAEAATAALPDPAPTGPDPAEMQAAALEEQRALAQAEAAMAALPDPAPTGPDPVASARAAQAGASRRAGDTDVLS